MMCVLFAVLNQSHSMQQTVHKPYLGKSILLTYVYPFISIMFILLFISTIIHSLLKYL